MLLTWEWACCLSCFFTCRCTAGKSITQTGNWIRQWFAAGREAVSLDFLKIWISFLDFPASKCWWYVIPCCLELRPSSFEETTLEGPQTSYSFCGSDWIVNICSDIFTAWRKETKLQFEEFQDVLTLILLPCERDCSKAQGTGCKYTVTCHSLSIWKRQCSYKGSVFLPVILFIYRRINSLFPFPWLQEKQTQVTSGHKFPSLLVLRRSDLKWVPFCVAPSFFLSYLKPIKAHQLWPCLGKQESPWLCEGNGNWIFERASIVHLSLLHWKRRVISFNWTRQNMHDMFVTIIGCVGIVD